MSDYDQFRRAREAGLHAARVKKIEGIIKGWEEPGKSPKLIHAEIVAAWMRQCLEMLDDKDTEIADLQARLAWFEERVGDPWHVVNFSPPVDGITDSYTWAIAHPFSCRPNIIDCPMTEYVGRNADHFMERYGIGRYSFTEQDGELSRL